MNYLERELSVEGYKIHSRSIGTGPHTILFIPGASISSHIWDDQLNDESLRQYRLITIDLPGHGLSGRNDNYRMIDMAKIFPALISGLCVDEYIIVACSYSTCLVAEAAPMLNNKCKGFFMSPCILNHEISLLQVFKMHPESYVMSAATAPPPDIKAFARRLVYHRSSPVVDLYVKDYLSTDPAFRLANAKIFETGDWTDELANLRNTGLPIGIVFGKEDEIVNTDYLDNFGGRWQNKTFLVENAGHYVNADQPVAYNKLLLQFANEVL